VSGLTLGANDYITKPFSPLELVARVPRLLQFVESSQRDLRNWPFNGCCERYRRAPTP
jgi:DNA-binding response OmpR family regulator